MERNSDALANYQKKLSGKVQQILLNKKSLFLETNIDDLVDVIAEPVLFDSNLASVLQGSYKTQLMTNRDRYLLYTVSGKKKLNETKVIELSDQWFLTGEQNFFKGAIRNKEKKREIEKYISIRSSAKRSMNKLDISCSCFCPNAKQLLAFQYAGLRTDAEQRRHSLYWRAIRTNPPKEFCLEDYWYYEQETGTNLSVEIAALLDGLYEQYGNMGDIVQNWDKILEIIYKCIEENYCYIANIPAIDWKINVMKVACTTVVEVLTSAFDGIDRTILPRLSEGISKSGMFSTHRAGSLFKGEPDMQAFASNILRQKLSAVFNQILCVFTMDSFGANPFTINMISLEEFIHAFDQSKKVPRTSIVRGDEVLHKAPDPVELSKGDINACEWETLKAFLSEDELCTCFQSAEAIKNKTCKGYEALYARKNVLIFCGCESEYAKSYLDNVKNFILRNKLFNDESDKLEIKQLSGIKMPQSIQDKHFIRIHQAVASAIEKSNDDIKEEKMAPST